MISDFSRVLLFPKDETYKGSLNSLNKELIEKYGENYAFFNYFKLNEELIEYYKSLNLPLYIFTTDVIQDNPALKPNLEKVFRRIFRAKELNIVKTEPKAYEFLVEELGLDAKEILYIDDNKDNIQAAYKAGLVAFLFENNENTRNFLSTIKRSL